MSYIDSIKQDIEEYIGIYHMPESSLEIVLASVVSKYSSDIYLDCQKLQRVLEEHELREDMIYKVCLMTQVDGLKALLERDERIQRADLDRFVRNAADKTGFERTTVMELTRAIMKSLGTVMDYSKIKFKSSSDYERAYTIPKISYDSHLKDIAYNFGRMKQGVIGSEIIDVSSLEPLVAAGIPKAKYYMGSLCMSSQVKGTKSEQGLRLLREAAESGVAEAAAELGDYYYREGAPAFWSQAYEYYTGFGALALNKERREALTSIMNHRIYNKKILGSSIFFVALMIATVIIAPGKAVYAAHYIFGGFCMIIDIAMIAAALLHYKCRPYDNIYYLPVSLFAIWSLYIAVRLVF